MMVALLALAVSAGPVRVELVWSVPIPVEATRYYHRFQASPSGAQVAWSAGNPPATYWASRDTKEVAVLTTSDPSWTTKQHDSGWGYLTLRRGLELVTFDLANGKAFPPIGEFRARTGNLALVQDSPKTLVLVDVRTGALIQRMDNGWGQSSGTEPYRGLPAWESPRRRLFLVGRGDRANDVKDVVEYPPGGWEIRKRSWLSDYAMSFAKLIGNPESGPFAVFEETNRGAYATGIFRKDLSRIDATLLSVVDIGANGILGFEGDIETEYGPTVYTRFVCLDLDGILLWSNLELANPQSTGTGRWVGADVLTSDGVLRSGKTGKPIDRVPTPANGIEIGARGSVFYVVRTDPSPAVEAYRIVR